MSSMSVRSAGSSESGSFSSSMAFGDDSGKSTVIISEPSSIQVSMLSLLYHRRPFIFRLINI